MGGAGSDPRASQACRRAAQGAVRRARPGRLHRVRTRRARGARLGRRPERALALARPEDLARPGRRVPGHLALAIRAPHPADFRLAAGRRPHAVPRRRPDAVDLPLPRSRSVAFLAGQALRARVGEARADRAQHQPPLAGRPREVVQRVVPARAPRAGRPDLGRSAVPSRFAARERASRRRRDLALRLRPRGGSEEGRCYRPGGFGQQGDPRPQPRAPRRDRAGAQGSGRALQGARHRAARREAGGAGSLRADARAPAPRRPHRLARVPASALVRPHPRRSSASLIRPA